MGNPDSNKLGCLASN